MPTVVVVDSQARFRAVNWQDLNTGSCNLDIVYRILRFGRRQCLVGVYLATEDAVIVGNQYGAQGYFVYRRNGCLMEARSCERIRVLAIREGGMLRSKSFAYITAADFIVRSAYQMGKTPLLPLYAASLGASDALLGFIVSVSTLTGMFLKPIVGVLSDRWGRRGWLILGTVFFTVMPFMYRFVSTPEQLFAIRIMHGMATAIYGPVTLAYVAEQSKTGRAERLAWFSTARNAGYIVGPAAAGWMLLSMDPVEVFTIVGLMSCVAFIPVLLLPEIQNGASRKRLPILMDSVASLWSGGRTGAVWLAGGMEAGTYMGLYATKTYLPVYAWSLGFNTFEIGSFFAVQEAAHIIANPIGGRLGDRLGYQVVIPIGMLLIAFILPILPIAINMDSVVPMMALAIGLGIAQALVFPSTVAMASAQISNRSIATGMGLIGTMKNAGKVSGPIVAAGLVSWQDYTLPFQVFGLVMFAGAVFVWRRSRVAGRIATASEMHLGLEPGSPNSAGD
ncbi:MAG: MFS transporter [SAR202 cluster bacterium]|nr:MFS transporter [SAR202 cluster bacterium]